MSILLLTAIVIFITGAVLTESVFFGICEHEQYFDCRGPLSSLGQPLGMMSFALGIVFIVLLFLPQDFFRSWLKFAAWTIPLGALWIATTPDSCGGGLGFALCLDREIVTWYVCGTVLVISLLVIIWHAWRGRKV